MIRPIHDRIALRRVEEQYTGMVVIPDVAKEKSLIGEVVAVGNGRLLENGTMVPLDVKTGDKVLVGKYSGAEVEIDGETLLLIREADILGIIQ